MLSFKVKCRFSCIRFERHLSIRKSSTIGDALSTNIDRNLAQNQILLDLKQNLTFQKEENDNESNVPQLTLIEHDTIVSKRLPRYRSMKKYCDPFQNIPQLAHNLHTTLTSPGVHYQSDPRTRWPNYDPSLLSIPHIDELKMDKIGSFTPSSKDNKLLSIATKHNLKNTKQKKFIKYFSSTSSMTSLLIKFHKMLSNDRPINTSMFSKSFPQKTSFTSTSDIPTSLVVTKKSHDIYSVDADRSVDTEITLSILGNALELMLTKSPTEFQKYLKSNEDEPEVDESAYHYARIGKFMVRSQLDAVDSRLPGTGTFDIKTRAVCAIRMDLAHTDYFPTNYEITKTYGVFESFERELFDAARIVMFKYSLQARLGNMDGIFMAFHNIKKFLGYQYLPLSEIDNIFFGDYELLGNNYNYPALEKKSNDRSDDEVNKNNQEKLQNIVDDFHNNYQTKREALSSFVADHELRFSVELLTRLLDIITKELDGKPFRVMFKKMKRRSPTTDKDVETSSYDSIVCVVNLLSSQSLAELQMMAKDRLEENKHLTKDLIYEDMTPSERIKFFNKYVSEFKQKYFSLNNSIMQANGDKLLAYEITVKHYFNDVECQEKHPFPTVDFLDHTKNQRWDLEYEINMINNLQEKNYLYNKMIKDIAFNAFRETEGVDIDVYTEDGVKYDENASIFQNMTRAYSAKATKRSACKY
ncbi:hypothetical protein CANINC_003683 [Pichia inconspicua]|uniref:Uncharacterized protein n=1 Tax=Pichia inconspicua TaxID=52247 RepID=A0A4T0WZ48_9ASCO|nr:hypothetical protein CANINC_003683 [[Candida] inconspicua]